LLHDAPVSLYLHMKIGKSLRFLIAILYLTFISVLFFLPGSAFPETTWLHEIWFDKWVHVSLFAVLIVVWCWALQTSARLKVLVITAVVYGIFVEWVQHNFVANRSFDWGDWTADVVGTLVGLLVWNRYIKK
jgi:hypothetical protein